MTQQEVIKAFNQSLDNTEFSGRAALDTAIRASSDFNNFNEVAEQFLADQRAAKNWYTFLVEKCGIILDNEDTGAISGADAGSGTVKTMTTIIPCEGDASYPSGSSFTVDGLTIYGIPDKSQLTEDQQYIVQGLYSWWIRDALLLIKESYGYSFTEADTTAARLKLKFFYNENIDGLAAVQSETVSGKDSGKTYESRVLLVNMAKFQDMDPDDRHPRGLDTVLLHELVHGVMASNVNYFNDIPGFLLEGGTAELMRGVDKVRNLEIIQYAQKPEVFEKILTAVPQDGSNDYEIYAGGYIFMRYFAKQAATDTTFDYDTYRATVSVDDANFATNYWDSVTMTGSDDTDTITNSGYNVSIIGGDGSDTINNYGLNVTIDAGDDEDTINNYGSEVSINAGADNDLVINQSNNVTIDAGKGNDSVSNTNNNVTVDCGSDNDYVYNTGDNLSVDLGDGDDYIVNRVISADAIDVINYDFIESSVLSGDDNVILISNGQSTLQAYYVELHGGNNATIRGGAGDDNINNQAKQTRIYGDGGSDSITNSGSQVSVYGGAGDDVIANGSSSVDINATSLVADNSGHTYYGTVFIEGRKARIYGGDGNDSVTNECNDVRVYGQNGADSITNSGTAVSVYGGADDDYVTNSGDRSYISLGDGDDVIFNSGEYSSVKGDAGNDFLYVLGDGNMIAGDAGADTFYNIGDYNLLSGGAGNDLFLNYGDSNSLSGGAGNDSVYSSGARASINGGAGNDYIESEGYEVYLVGGAGNDTIRNTGCHVTISGGTGDDSIVNDGGKHIVFRFNGSCGFDTFSGFNAGDTVQITSGTYSAVTSGNDVIVSVGNAALTLTDTADKEFYVITSDGTTDTISFDPTILTLTDDDANKQTLDAGVTYLTATARTKATRIVANALDNIILGGSGKDTIYAQNGDDTIDGDAGNDRLSGQNGNDFLYGGAGNDSLSGGAGMDTLWGGLGNDTLTGGSGVDTFIYDGGDDVITDYRSGELVEINSGTFTDAAFSSNRLTLTIDDGGSLTFNNVTTSTVFNINDRMYHVSGNTVK